MNRPLNKTSFFFLALVTMGLCHGEARSIGWNYTRSEPLKAEDTAGAPGFEQSNWNNHRSPDQGPGKVPFQLRDSTGAATSATVTSWSLSTNNSWRHQTSVPPQEKNQLLMNDFTNSNPAITFENIPYGNYDLVIYYGDNEAGPPGPTATIKVGAKSRRIRTGDTSASSFAKKGYLKATDTNSNTPTNYAVFKGLFLNNLTVSLSSNGNNGISAIQIIEGETIPESNTPIAKFPANSSTGFKPWQSLSWTPGGPKEISYDLFLWRADETKPSLPNATGLKTTTFSPPRYLQPSTTYHWQVMTNLFSGRTLTSGIFKFTTGDSSNEPPFDISGAAAQARSAEVEALKGITRLITKTPRGYPLPDGTTLAFYGDSITDVFTYFDDLADALKTAKTNDPSFPAVHILNRGINGATTDDLLNLPDGDQFSGGSGPNPPLPFKAQIDQDLATLPPGETYLAILQIGINDVLQGDMTPVAIYESRIAEMVDYVLSKGHRVAILSPTGINEIPIAQVTNDGLFDDDGNALLNGYTSALARIAESRKLAYINQRDAYHLIYQNENYQIANDPDRTVSFPRKTGILQSDSVHPNPRGKKLSSEFAAQAISLTFAPSGEAAPSGFVPQPQNIQPGEGACSLTPKSRIFYSTRTTARPIENTLEPLARVLASELELITGSKPRVLEKSKTTKPGPGDISLEFSALTEPFAITEETEDQSYTLVVGEVTAIRSPYYKGVAYGTATLQQAIEETVGAFKIKKQTITDRPAAAYRAVMIDLARQPGSLEMVKEVVRPPAELYKIRYLHLHLTDDQNFTFPFPPVTDKIENNFVYPRESLRELAAYADARGVTIIPELDLPGHSSRLRQSGYLSPDENDADVADPANFAKIQAIIDDMLAVFASSPYFHIGGDESGAGEALVPFLAAMNKHLRNKPAAEKKRLLVWEGFGGSPTTELPATGDDRVIVLAWEHRYNTPWNLLQNGYQVVNASWRPLYIVGSGATTRYPHVSQRMWTREVIHSWNKDTFMHWQPGVPVFEDRGPADPIANDSMWDAAYLNKSSQVIGGQMLSWEQNEKTIVRDLIPRLPAMADRLWNPLPDEETTAFTARLDSVAERALTIVQPIEILPLSTTPGSPLSQDYRTYPGDQVMVTLRNRTKVPGTIRYTFGNFNSSLTAPGFDSPPSPDSSSTAYSAPFPRRDGFAIRAALFRSDTGKQVDGTAWAHFHNLKNRVSVTEYQVPRSPLAKVPDFASYPADSITNTYELPLLHGPYLGEKVKGQLFRSNLAVPGSGTFSLSVQTSDGRATVYIDLNKNGLWEDTEKIIINSPPNDRPVRASIELKKGIYPLRVDHATGAIGALLWVKIDGPGTNGERDISGFISLSESR